MAYTNNPQERIVSNVPVMVDYHDRVRWGPILAGLVVAISTQLVLSGLGAAIGLTGLANSGTPQADAAGTGTAVGIWSIISLFISLFLGGWVAARVCGPMNRSTALLNGAILWATTLAVSAWLLTTGVAGAFGVVASNAGEIINQAQTGGIAVPNQAQGLTPEQTRQLADNAARAGWAFALGSLLGLVATLIGSSLGARQPHTAVAQAPADRPYVR
ncbi:hypothetical protein [Thermocoleostomius sinensis]|uniref:PhnA-like protein n=1 Tax=Thermocoleostomius sinensis A174 TaxID=2016057 RepID=A0A9E8Z8F4_9CYAN|nr:hypothetical protein [Thermocoleostomius sinensis]WAL58405.1 hypothetical protein OXH18_14565 [Thermocoleostomius sinensis A174]